MSDAIRYLTRAIEADMYVGKKQPYAGLMTLLVKLGIKSARLDNRPFSKLKMESLDAVLKSATFDDSKIKNWKVVKK